MKRKNFWIVLGTVIALLTLCYNLIVGQPFNLGPKAIGAIIVGIALVIIGLAIPSSKGQKE